MTISISLVGSLSRSTMLPASRAAWVPVFIATPTSAWAKRRRVVGAVAAHGDQLAVGLLGPDQLKLPLGCRFGEEIIDAGFGGDRSGGQRVVAVTMTVRMPIWRSVGEALADGRLDDVLQVDDTQDATAFGDDQRRAAGPGDPLDDLPRSRGAASGPTWRMIASTAPLRIDVGSSPRPSAVARLVTREPADRGRTPAEPPGYRRRSCGSGR